MTKIYTEQWRKGTLEQKYYYVKYFGNGQKPFVEIELKNFLLDLVKVKDADKMEVLAPVPSHDEYNELVQKIHILNEACMKLENAIGSQADYFRQKISVLESQLSSISEQLKEAHEVIKECRRLIKREGVLTSTEGAIKEKLKGYLDKWGG